jgi:23S rRNA-/tRNA-specific pseudouridylate synthase
MCIGTEDNPGKVLYLKFLLFPNYFHIQFNFCHIIQKSAKTEIKVLRRGYFRVRQHSLSQSPLTTPSTSPSKLSPKYIQVSLIRLHPITGRRHQLRLHCQFLNHPIVGDWHYERQIMNYTDTWRMMLHAQKLVIPLNKSEGKVLNADAGDPFSELVIEDLEYVNGEEIQIEFNEKEIKI